MASRQITMYMIFGLFVVAVAYFGVWENEGGLPRFRWTLDQIDPSERVLGRACWPNTEEGFPIGLRRCDHYHHFGNDQVTARATDGGRVEVLVVDRGPTWLNAASDEADGARGGSWMNVGGGFSYAVRGRDVMSSAYEYAPASARERSSRRFGVGYAQFSTVIPLGLGVQLRVNRTIFAPFGLNASVVALVEAACESAQAAACAGVRLVEMWDVNRVQLLTEWVRTGDAAPAGDAVRLALNDAFEQSVRERPGRVLVASMAPVVPPPVSPRAESSIDWYPGDVFLAPLDDDTRALTDPAGLFGNQRRFFGNATNASAPEALVRGLNGSLLDAAPAGDQPALLAMRTRPLDALARGERVRLAYAYGFVPRGSSVDAELAGLRQETVSAAFALFEATCQRPWRGEALAVSGSMVSGDVAREATWRSAQLRQMTGVRDYYSDGARPRRIVAQGSAYLFLHGADGAPRDQALSAAALALVAPDVARETLEVVLCTQDAETGAMAYAIDGHGVSSTALGLHAFPSDLDIAVLFGVDQYVTSTADVTWLTRPQSASTMPFHPRDAVRTPPGAEGRYTVLAHLRAAFVHLRDVVGRGDHGLVRIGDGDWDDGVVVRTTAGDPLAYAFTVESGESVPNTQMAVFVLRRVARWMAGVDKALAAEMAAYAAKLDPAARSALSGGGGGAWFVRAWMRDGLDLPFVVGSDAIHLQAQPWGLLAGLVDEDERRAVLAAVDCDLGSAIGPRQVAGGLVWPAVSQLMTLAHAQARNWSAAFRILEQHTLARHAELFPRSWVGLLSGPDGWVPETCAGCGRASAGDLLYPGGTWHSVVTPMTDMALFNSNPDAMFVLALTRSLGIQPSALENGTIAMVIDVHSSVTFRSRVLTIDLVPTGTGTLDFDGLGDISFQLRFDNHTRVLRAHKNAASNSIRCNIKLD